MLTKIPVSSTYCQFVGYFSPLSNFGTRCCCVQDMVQIALAESNSARDGRIIYTKLVKKVDP
jgi:hypothetical protein